jgi:phosphomevalonate kinase
VIARAPGKVVLSGAYAVLEGAPSLVAAVDRYVIADASRPADFVTPEVRAALGDAPAPWFDASALREGERKLGLGSSAAIVVASLAAVQAHEGGATDDAALRDAVFARALVAHRQAQGGGSGIDVASSAWGGFILAQRAPAPGRVGARADQEALPHASPPNVDLAVRPATLPSLIAEVWACPDPASTAEFLRRVRGLAEADPDHYAQLMGVLIGAAERAAAAVVRGEAPALLAALAAQRDGLDALGRGAAIPIFTDAVREIARVAQDEDAIVMPAGAGGGDIAMVFAPHPPSARLREAARTAGLSRLDLELGARGVHLTQGAA